ncbi:MAG: HD domain-containing protein [Bdellovibrionota bacterium]
MATGESRNYPDEVLRLIERMRAIPVIHEILEQLSAKLPSNLRYHSAEHTMDVFSEAMYFAYTDQLSARDVELLAVAAAFHDAGFLVRSDNNEPVGAEMAVAAMRKAGEYAPEEIELVRTMILDTQLLQNGKGYSERPSSHLSRYLLDADLSNLGREDFMDKMSLLGQEFGVNGEKQMAESFQLLKNHCWLTPAGKSLREAQKASNVESLRRRMS